jgi:hypothetical protein
MIWRRDTRKLDIAMCRNIRPLFNFDPPATPEEIHAASIQFVRKITGFHKPSHANQPAYNRAVDEIDAICARLLHSLATSSPAKNRQEEATKAKARAAQRLRS